MSDELDNFLKLSSEAGRTDSEGAFTVNLEAARKKMAKFQLADPHFFILKLVQAGVLASKGMDISYVGHGWHIVYRDWSPELSLEAVREKLCSAIVSSCDTALDHLAIALNSLWAMIPEGIGLSQRVEGEHSHSFMNLGESLEITHRDGDWSVSRLTIYIPWVSALKEAQIRELIEERCGFAPIPINLDGTKILPRLPLTSGNHRDIFFRQNQVLAASSTKGTSDAFEVLSSNVEDAEFTSQLFLTVDLDPMAQIWLCKAGVLLECKVFELGVPGLTGVVEADHLETDLTGTQFLLNDDAEELAKWLGGQAGSVLDRALRAVGTVDAEAAPVTLNGWVDQKDAGAGCGLGFLSVFSGFYLFLDGFISGGLFSSLVALGVFFPGIYVGAKVHKKGCEKDSNSDLNAKASLREKLLKAKAELDRV